MQSCCKEREVEHAEHAFERQKMRICRMHDFISYDRHPTPGFQFGIMVPSSDYGTGIFQRGPERWYSWCYCRCCPVANAGGRLRHVMSFGKRLPGWPRPRIAFFRNTGGGNHGTWRLQTREFLGFRFDQAMPSQILRAMSLS